MEYDKPFECSGCTVDDRMNVVAGDTERDEDRSC